MENVTKGKGAFFAVGVGPGDPELLTLKAIKTIERCGRIAVPKSGSGDNIALKIAEAYLEGKDIIYCDMPMSKDKSLLDSYHEKSANDIAVFLERGDDVAFLTLGDPAIYSTVMYVHRKLKARGYATFMVPGITSFCGAAASLDVSLCEREEVLHIIPATFRGKTAEYADDPRVLMKSGKSIMEIKDSLKGSGAMMVECATMKNEKIYRDISDLKEPSSYFSLVVVPGKGKESK